MVVTSKYTRFIIFLSVLCPVAALPFFQPGGVMRSTVTDLYGMMLLLPAGCILLLPKKEVKISAADILFGCFLIICCIKPALEFDGFACVKNMSLMLGYIAFRMLPAEAIAGLLAAMVVSCLIQSVYGFMQYAEYAESRNLMFPLTASFLNPAHLAFFLSIGTIIAAGMFLFPGQFSGFFPFGKERLFQAIAAVAAVWTAFVLVLTESRTAWVATLFAVSRLLYMRYAPGIRRLLLPKFVRPAVAALLLCVLCTGGYALYYYKKDSADGRLLIWKITAEMIGRRPVTGNGPGAFRSDYLYAQAAYFAERPDAPERILADNTTRPFNEYLRIAYEHGLVGLLLLAATIYLAGRSSISPAPKALLVAGAVIGCFSYPLEIRCIKVYLLIALALQAKTLPPIRITRCTFPVRCAYAACWCAAAVIISVYAHHVYKCTRAGRQTTETVADIFAASYPVLRDNHEYLSLYTRFLRREGKTEEALNQMEKLARLSPSSMLFCDMGDLYAGMRRYAEAEQCYRLARNMMPAAFVPLQQLMTLYAETEQPEKAKAIAEAIVRQPVKVKTNVTDQIKKEAIDFLEHEK